MLQGSPNCVKFPTSVHREIDHVLRHKHAARPEVAFDSAQQHLLEHLYNANFQVRLRFPLASAWTSTNFSLDVGCSGTNDGLTLLCPFSRSTELRHAEDHRAS